MITLINDVLTPISAFQKLRGFNPIFLLESVENTGSAGRFSYIGFDPVVTVVHSPAGARGRDGRGDLISKLRTALAKVPNHRGISQRLPMGFVGMTPFEATVEFNPSAFADSSGQCSSEAIYVLPRFIVIFDHLRQTLSIEQVDRSELDESAAREIIRALRSPLEHKPAGGGFVVSQPKLPGDGVHDRIREVRRAIDEGMIYQAVVSERIEGRTDIDPLVVYRALRSLFPSPYLYYLNLAGKHVIGSSPETLVRLEGDLVQICPLSAIRACSGDARQDLSLGEELLSDPLETSKHHVFVEQARNDCASVCDPGSVQLARFKTVERSMKHIGLRSVIRGTKTGEYDQFDVYRSAFPAASVTGAPKAEAAALIIRLDSEPRGVYGGSVGYFSVNNTMEHAIAVRTIVIEDGGFTTQAGVVITAAGNPESEAMNIANKCRSLLRALEIGGELL